MSDRRSDDAPGAKPPRDARHGAGHARPAPGGEGGEDPAAGTVDSPIVPGEAQAGDLSEAGANRGGPVDVFPLRGRARKEGSPG